MIVENLVRRARYCSYTSVLTKRLEIGRYFDFILDRTTLYKRESSSSGTDGLAIIQSGILL